MASASGHYVWMFMSSAYCNFHIWRVGNRLLHGTCSTFHTHWRHLNCGYFSWLLRVHCRHFRTVWCFHLQASKTGFGFHFFVFGLSFMLFSYSWSGRWIWPNDTSQLWLGFEAMSRLHHQAWCETEQVHFPWNQVYLKKSSDKFCFGFEIEILSRVGAILHNIFKVKWQLMAAMWFSRILKSTPVLTSICRVIIWKCILTRAGPVLRNFRGRPRGKGV